MTDDAIEQAARQLAALRTAADRTAIEDLPEDVRPKDLVAAYAIQNRLREILTVESLGAPCGWKIGCTTRVMQDYLKIPHPCAGTLYSARTYKRSKTLVAADYLELGLECEIAVEIGRDLPEQQKLYTQGDVTDAIRSVMASIEIVEHRFSDFSKAGTPSLVADDFFSAGCVLGEPITPEAAGDLSKLRGGFSLNGSRPADLGSGDAILGHPLVALAWIADHASRLGTPLRAGQVITLGSVVKTIYPEPGQQIEARFTRLPPVRIDVL